MGISNIGDAWQGCRALRDSLNTGAAGKICRRTCPLSVFPVILALLVFLAGGFALKASPARLAIVPETPELDEVADVLTADFSKETGVQLLERSQVEKAFHEQEQATASADPLKLGALLGADGLLLLQTGNHETNRFVNVQLVAVNPGVVLSSQRFPWPTEDSVQWAALLERCFNPYFTKLEVSATEAVPISIVNLRSALQSTEGGETERELTLLMIDRLSRERRLFVLERTHMNLLGAEKDLQNSNDSAFWNGSYLLDGTLDSDGYSPGTITISARLVPPKGGPAIPLEASGSRTNLPEVADLLAKKILQSLKLEAVAPWNPADEAAQFYAEAQWAVKWRLYPQAIAAAESAWALGRRDADTAALLIEAYTDSLPEPPFHQDGPPIQVVPDASQFAPLLRALDVFLQNAPAVLTLPNPRYGNSPGTTAAVELLLRGAGQLESYYYAVEARPGHEEELAALREKMLAGFEQVDQFPIYRSSKYYKNNPLRTQYDELEWNEGGLCFEQPEGAPPFYRRRLEAGLHPGRPPRIIGWTWPDRQRVPSLLRQFVRDVCAETNPAVRLEGLHQAMLLAPNDEQQSFTKCEQALYAEMWDKRSILFGDPDSAVLLEPPDDILRLKFQDPSDSDCEPFAAFQHRMRLDYLMHETNWNDQIFSALFTGYDLDSETPDRARELVPVLAAYQEKLPNPRTVEYALTAMRRIAGYSNPPPAQIVMPAGKVLGAKFVAWTLARPDGETRRPEFYGMILRNGQLWLRVRYISTNFAWPPDFLTSYLHVDPVNGVREEIPFPGSFGVPGDQFEVNSNALFVEANGHLFQFGFGDRQWSQIPVPMEGSSQMAWVKDRLYIARDDGLVALEPASGTVQVLASSRRQPPINQIDALWQSPAWIAARSQARLTVVTKSRCLDLEPASGQWEIRPAPPINCGILASGDGTVLQLGETGFQRFLVGFADDDTPFQPLISQRSRDYPAMSAAAMHEPYGAGCWDWPSDYSLRDADIAGGDRGLWILSLRKVWNLMHQTGEEPVRFSDARQATLFRFEPGSRKPLTIGIQFDHCSGDLAPFRPPFDQTMQDAIRIPHHRPNPHYWLKTDSGLILGTPSCQGHWVITYASLAPDLQAQRKLSRQPPEASGNFRGTLPPPASP